MKLKKGGASAGFANVAALASLATLDNSAPGEEEEDEA